MTARILLAARRAWAFLAAPSIARDFVGFLFAVLIVVIAACTLFGWYAVAAIVGAMGGFVAGMAMAVEMSSDEAQP